MMTLEREQLERLISRVLDGEASPAEQAQLDAARRADPQAQALWNDTQRIDDLVGAAVRDEMSPPAPIIQFPRHYRAARFVVGAIAAGIAMLAWLHPLAPAPDRQKMPQPRPVQAGLTGAPANADVIEPLPSSYERPEVRVRGTAKDLILIPADQPGLYWVVEVDHEQTHVVPLGSDF